MKKSKIGKAASELTRARFADELSSYTTLSKGEITALFPTQRDREELSELIDIVLNAADDNERRAKLINGIEKVAGAVTTLVQSRVLGV